MLYIIVCKRSLHIAKQDDGMMMMILAEKS